MKMMLLNFTGVYREQGFLDWLHAQPGADFCEVNLSEVEGTNCYCDQAAIEEIGERLPAPLPAVRWIDSGDYHYMSYLLAMEEKAPFHLLLLDNHPDDQEPALGDVLSCGGWVSRLRKDSAMLRDVLTIGPEGCAADIPQAWLADRKGERVYLSIDKDIMERDWARTDWSQGAYSLSQVETMVERVFGSMDVIAIDICGELTESKGALPEDYSINLQTNIDLYKFISNHLK